MSQRVTQVFADLLANASAVVLRATQVLADVLANPGTPAVRATTIHVEVCANPPKPDVRVTQITVQILATRTPIYGTLPLVLTDLFPNDISYNSVGSTRFATDVIVVDNGDDQRNQRWHQPLMEYDVAYGVRTMEQLLSLIAFFRAMRGRFHSFCYQDNVDYTSSVPVAYEARTAPPITAFDQIIGVGDGVTYVWQLVKVYSSYSRKQTRLITQPQPGTVLIGLNGVATTAFTVDVTTGLVTLTTPFKVTFGDPISYDGSGHLAGEPGDFTPFAPYVGSSCTIQGFVNSVNNANKPHPVTINSVGGDGSSMHVGYPSGYGGVTDYCASGLVIAIHPAPASGQNITAGFLFYVPVRFDTDILPVTIEDYGVGGSNSVKLIEVRASDNI